MEPGAASFMGRARSNEASAKVKTLPALSSTSADLQRPRTAPERIGMALTHQSPASVASTAERPRTAMTASFADSLTMSAWGITGNKGGAAMLRKRQLHLERMAAVSAHNARVKELHEIHLESNGTHTRSVTQLIEARERRKDLRRNAATVAHRASMFIAYSKLITVNRKWMDAARVLSAERAYAAHLQRNVGMIQEAWRVHMRQRLWRRISKFLSTVKSSDTLVARIQLHIRCWRRLFAHKVVTKFLRVFIKVRPTCRLPSLPPHERASLRTGHRQARRVRAQILRASDSVPALGEGVSAIYASFKTCSPSQNVYAALQRRILAVRRERRRILAHEWDRLEDEIMEAEKRDFRIRSSGISSFEKKRLETENKDRKKVKMKPGIPYGQAAELAERDPYAVHRRAELSVKSLMKTDRKVRARYVIGLSTSRLIRNSVFPPPTQMEELLSKHKIGGGVWARQMQQKVHGAGAPKLPHRVRDAEVFALLKRKVIEHISLAHNDDDIAPVEGAAPTFSKDEARAWINEDGERRSGQGDDAVTAGSVLRFPPIAMFKSFGGVAGMQMELQELILATRARRAREEARRLKREEKQLVQEYQNAHANAGVVVEDL